MYTFADREEAGSSLTLRPEATAGIVRAVIEHNLINTDPARQGVCARSHVPPRAPAEGPLPPVPPGRRRGVRAEGARRSTSRSSSCRSRYLDACGVTGYELVLNSVGDAKCRPAYVETLRDGAQGQGRRDVRRLPAPRRRPIRCASSTARCRRTSRSSTRCRGLPITCANRAANTSRRSPPASTLRASPIRLSHRLVRGLDYYVRTTFEVTSSRAGRAEQRPRRRPLRRARQGTGWPGRSRHRLRARHGAARDAAGAARGRERAATCSSCRSPRAPTTEAAAAAAHAARGRHPRRHGLRRPQLQVAA